MHYADGLSAQVRSCLLSSIVGSSSSSSAIAIAGIVLIRYTLWFMPTTVQAAAIVAILLGSLQTVPDEEVGES